MGFTKEATAGVMGNMKHESGMRTNNLQDSFNSKLGYSDEGYTDAVDSGKYGESKFVHDSAGYGLVQFTSTANKQTLYDSKKSHNASIADMGVQLDALNTYLNAHHKALIGRLQKSKDVTASVKDFMNDYERPGKPMLSSRISGANAIYEKFKDWSPSSSQLVESSYNVDYSNYDLDYGDLDYSDYDSDYDYDYDDGSSNSTNTGNSNPGGDTGIPSLGIPGNAFVKGDGRNAISTTNSGVFKKYSGKRYGLKSNSPKYQSKYDIQTSTLNDAFRYGLTGNDKGRNLQSKMMSKLSGKDSTYIKALKYYQDANTLFSNFRSSGKVNGVSTNRAQFIQDVRSHPNKYASGTIRTAIQNKKYQGKKFANDTSLFKAIYGGGDLGYIDPYIGNYVGYGDIAMDELNTPSTINTQVPDIDYSKFVNTSNLNTEAPTYHQYVITSSDNKMDQDYLHAILTNTYNVRAERVEELLESIDKKLDNMSKPKPTSSKPSTSNSFTNMFPNNEIPQAVDRISR